MKYKNDFGDVQEEMKIPGELIPSGSYGEKYIIPSF